MGNKYKVILYASLLSLLLATEVEAQSLFSLFSKRDSTSVPANQDKLPAKKSRISDNQTHKVGDFNFGFKPFLPLMTNMQGVSTTENEKLLSNVKIFPNPVSDQINLSFKLSKDINVSIKVMDALGNEVTTLLSQRLTAGEQNNSFNIGNKLNQGFYFIRVIAGSETIIKRVEVL